MRMRKRNTNTSKEYLKEQDSIYNSLTVWDFLGLWIKKNFGFAFRKAWKYQILYTSIGGL